MSQIPINFLSICMYIIRTYKGYVPLAASAEEHLNLAEIVFIIDFSKPGTRGGAFEESVRAVGFNAISFKPPILRFCTC